MNRPPRMLWPRAVWRMLVLVVSGAITSPLVLQSQTTGATSSADQAPAPAGPTTPAASCSDDTLQFTINEGAIENDFYRRGPVAAHLLASSGMAPRLIVAFSAGNTGAGVWFDNGALAPGAAGEAPLRALLSDVHFGLAPGAQLTGVEQPDGLRGVTAHLRADAKSLTLRRALLANIRTIRDYIGAGARDIPPEFVAQTEPGPPLVFRRTTIDGHHVELRIAPGDGTTLTRAGEEFRFDASSSGGVTFTVTTLTDYPLLTPFAPDQLFTAGVADRPRDKEVFAFLASREKFAAGSWRFLTYFGRDTLMTVQLLMPVLQPEVIEAALGSVLERLGPDGEVAHEEGIGEFAAGENKKLPHPPADILTPVLDYKMIDSGFLLAPAVAAYLLDTPAGRARATVFLSRRTSNGERYDARLRRNLALVLARTAPFAAKPAIENLVSLKPGLPVGNWRDSESGLGGGRFAFDVNAALAPAALRAAARLYRSELLGADSERATQAEHAVETWRAAAAFFCVVVAPDEARRRVTEYARSLNLDPAAAIASIDGPVLYHALSLEADGRPVSVMNTDEGFLLFFTEPAPEELDAVARQILRPFPAGLHTAVGLVVANPVFGDAPVQRLFTPADYHGTVVWSWQQALMAAGLKRQLARTDLPAGTRANLTAAERALWRVITAMQAQSAGELWSWEPRGGTEVFAPFGQIRGHVDESNAAQLWSTVYLAVQPPGRKQDH